MRERIRLAQVFAVARRILRDQNQFLYAFFSELMRFGDDRTKAPAAKMAAHLRNETEGAGTVAAFGNLDERVVTGRGEHARSRFVVKISRALISERKHRQRPRICLWVANAED